MDTLTIKPLKSSAPLSKTRFVNGVKCPMLAFLEVRTEAQAAELSATDQSRFETGDAVGVLARKRCDQRLAGSGLAPGILISEDPREHDQSVAKTASDLAAGAKVIYEAAFTYNGIKVRVDALERLDNGTFAINEVKSTSKFSKEKHGLDVAIQLYLLKGSNLDISRVNLVHLNKEYEWHGGEYDLEQLFIDSDVTDYATEAQEEIALQVENLLAVVKADELPKVPDTVACKKPYACPYIKTCPVERVVTIHPISELPRCRIGQGMHKRLTDAGLNSLLDVDEETARREMVTSKKELNEKWFNTWKATVDGTLIITEDGWDWVRALSYPIYHLDFETINPALPVVIGSHPFDQIPLQYSIHIESEDGAIEHRQFLAEADDPDPQKSLLDQLITNLGDTGTILQYTSFETKRLKELAELFPGKTKAIDAILNRIEDLADLVSNHVFHKDFHGKYSIKTVYPVLVPNITGNVNDGSVASYEDLNGVSSGDEASLVLLEYRKPETTTKQREELQKQLLAYCKLDTHAMVKVLGAIKATSESKELP